MKVTDMFKHRGESLTRHHAVFMQKVSPLRDYWGELKDRAHQSHLFDSLRDHAGQPANDGETDSDRARSIDAAAIQTLRQPINIEQAKAERTKTDIKPAFEMKPDAAALYEELQNQLGEIMHTGDWVLVDQHRINQFGEVTEDTQWIHTDPERATDESPFKTTIAHGFLTLALLPRLTDSVDPDNNLFPTAKMVVNIGLNQVRFPYPVKSGSRVRAVSTLAKVTPVRKGLEVEREIKVQIEGIRRPAAVVTSVIQLHF